MTHYVDTYPVARVAHRQCGCRIKRRRRWCDPCDAARIGRIGHQLTHLSTTKKED